MTNTIRAKFEELHPYKEGSNKSLYESLYAIFKEGWENGTASVKNPPENVTERYYGFCIPIVEYEAGWGSKPSGYMVGFTIEGLKERQKDFERSNTGFFWTSALGKPFAYQQAQFERHWWLQPT